MIEISAPVQPVALKEKTPSARPKDGGFGNILGAMDASVDSSATDFSSPATKSAMPALSAPTSRRLPTAKTGLAKPEPDSSSLASVADASASSSDPSTTKVADDSASEVVPVEAHGLPKDDNPDESWAQQAVTALAHLGIAVDAAKVAQLPPQGVQQLEAALRAAVKGLEAGQPKDDVAETVTQLLPTELKAAPSTDALPQLPASLPLSTLTANAASSDPGAKAASLAPVAVASPSISAVASASPSTPSTSEAHHQSQEICRLSEAVDSLVAPSDSPVLATPTLATPLTPPAPANCDDPATPKPAVAASKPRQEDLSAFLRLDAAGVVASRSDTQTEAAHAPLSFKPSGTAGEVLAHQVYDEFQFRTGQDQREMILKLWPRELGEVSVHVRIQQGERVEAKILVQNDTIRQALLEHTPVLRECLAKQGLELGNLSVSVGGGGDAPSQEQRRGRQGRGRSGRDWDDGIAQTSAFVPAGVDTGRRNGFNSIDVLT